MTLVSIPCTNPSITITPTLTTPPPFIFALSGYDGVGVQRPVTFDFSPLMSLGRSAGVRYFTYTIASNMHDWAMAGDISLILDTPGQPTQQWSGGETLHSPPPTATGYYIPSPSPGTQKFDADLKTFSNYSASAAFGPFGRYAAQAQLGATDNSIPVLGPCALIPSTFALNAFFQYYNIARSNLAYTNDLTPPTLTITNLTAWCEVDLAYNCTDPCSSSSIASGHTGNVCMQATWQVSSTLTADEGFIVTPGQGANLAIGGVDPVGCTIAVIVGCLTPEQVAAGNYTGPYTVFVVSGDRCTFGGVGYTRVYSGVFTVTHDTTCSEDRGAGNPFCYEDKRGRYHTTSTKSGGIVYRRSNFGTPAGLGWDTISNITPASGKALFDPRNIVDNRQTVRLVYAQQTISGGAWDGVYVVDSNDDGKTWGTALLAIASGKHPTIEIGQDGAFDIVVMAAYTGTGGGPGTITARVQAKGDTAFGAPFTFQDPSEVNLSVADDTFHIRQAKDGPSRWLLHVLIYGESSTSNWQSFDETMSWERVV